MTPRLINFVREMNYQTCLEYRQFEGPHTETVCSKSWRKYFLVWGDPVNLGEDSCLPELKHMRLQGDSQSEQEGRYPREPPHLSVIGKRGLSHIGALMLPLGGFEQSIEGTLKSGGKPKIVTVENSLTIAALTNA